MSASDDFILLLHAADGVQWADFLTKRLAAPQYGIRCVAKDLMSADTAESSSDIYSNESQCSTRGSGSNDNNNNSSNNTGSSNDLNTSTASSNRDSGQSSDNPETQLSSIPDCIRSCRACIVLMSPDILESDRPFPVDVTLLQPKQSVLMFLGVGIEEVRQYFGDQSDYAFKCRICLVDGSDVSICDALVQIIDAYEDQGGSSVGDEEDDNSIYKIPPSPKQLNKIEKVFPRELTEKDREVYVLLERPAEDDVIAVLDSAMSQEIQLTCVCGRLYKFTMPEQVKGDVSFKIECQSNCFGEETVQLPTSLDRLKAILAEEVNPLAALASALGLSSKDTGGVDTALAFRMQQLAPVTSFKTMFPCEDGLAISESDARSEFIYPSLLHFAADLNLRTFCQELLRYPGMLSAACTENKDGYFPSQIAANKGYSKLETDLIQFVEDNTRACHDDLYVEPSPPRPSPPPKPHKGKTHDYINEKPQGELPSDCYIDMSSLKGLKKPAIDLQTQHSDTELVSPASKSSDNVFFTSPSVSSKGDEDDGDSYQNMEELDIAKISRWDERASQKSSPGQLLSVDSSNSLSAESLGASGGASKKALKTLGICEEEFERSRAATLDRIPVQRGRERQGSPAGSDAPFPAIIPHGTRYPGISQNNLSGSRTLLSEDPTMYKDIKQRAMKDKLKSFFTKIKGKSSRSNSEGAIMVGSNFGVKKTPSNRSDRSAIGMRGHEHGSSGSKKKKSAEGDSQERDSGSYSDEEKDKSSPLTGKRNSKPKVFKEREKPMSRQLSRRVQAARNDSVSDAPTLPSMRQRKGGFKSFIKDP